jgi:hypothetical protein
MKGLREAGAVETGRRRIVVKNAEALGRIANGGLEVDPSVP